MKFLRSVLVPMLTLGLFGLVGAAQAASSVFEIESDQFQLRSAECISGGVFNPHVYFTSRASSQSTLDADRDVNVGSTVAASWWIYTGAEEVYQGLEADFLINGVAQEIVAGPVPLTSTWTRLAETSPVTVTDADAGSVLELSATRLKINPYNIVCIPATGDGVLGLYVNEMPELNDDVASTDFETSVTIDVLENDDATWDSGTISSSYPTAAELATQDDLAQVPAAALPSALALVTSPEHGDASIESYGQITYAPDQGFLGTDSFEYSLTDNDGASSTATVTITVAHDPTVVKAMEVTPSATHVDQGDSVDFSVEGFNIFGDSLGDVTGDVVFTSDVATDVVEGNRVTFPTASPHTITATHQSTGMTETVVIEVAAAVVPPKSVGSDDKSSLGTNRMSATGTSGPPLALHFAGGLLALVGAGLLLRGRRA